MRTIKPYRVPRTRSQAEIAGAVQGAYGNLGELMLYAHVPFCPVRCQFCEYTVVDPRVGTLNCTLQSFILARTRFPQALNALDDL